MRKLLLPILAIPLLAAAPQQQRGFALAVPSTLDPLAPFVSAAPAAPPSSSAYTPAPLPNRDASLPLPAASNEPHVAPNLFTRPNQYRGDGFTVDSTSQGAEERNNKPSAGFSLHIPMTGQ